MHYQTVALAIIHNNKLKRKKCKILREYDQYQEYDYKLSDIFVRKRPKYHSKFGKFSLKIAIIFLQVQNFQGMK